MLSDNNWTDKNSKASFTIFFILNNSISTGGCLRFMIMIRRVISILMHSDVWNSMNSCLSTHHFVVFLPYKLRSPDVCTAIHCSNSNTKLWRISVLAFTWNDFLHIPWLRHLIWASWLVEFLFTQYCLLILLTFTKWFALL